MRKLWILALAGALAIALGCGAGGGGGAESAAKDILEGVKKGDSKALIDHLDLKGMYEAQVPEEAREQMTYEKFEKLFTQGVAEEANKPAPEGFDYKILGSEVKGDATIVKVSVKEDKDAEWEESEVEFKKIDGKWKITAEGMQKLIEAE